jgi:hypothetical protein
VDVIIWILDVIISEYIFVIFMGRKMVKGRSKKYPIKIDDREVDGIKIWGNTTELCSVKRTECVFFFGTCRFQV